MGNKWTSEMNKKVLSYDLRTIPDGIDLDDMVYLLESINICIYDSSKNGEKPKILDLTHDPIFIDVNGWKNKENKIKELIDYAGRR